MTFIEPGSVRNRLLLTLPPRVLDELLPRLGRVEMPLRHVLATPDKPVDTVYFPESGWVSLLIGLQGGDIAEVGLIGQEGFVGLDAVFGVAGGLVTGVVQAPGVALAVAASTLRQVMEGLPAVRTLLMSYAMTFNTQVSVTAACNVRHPLRERLARWLLMSHDRSDGGEFPMTHEFLSLMLGVRRASISMVAAELRDAGLISHRQGYVSVVDRPGLEHASCGCNRLVLGQFAQLLQPMPDDAQAPGEWILKDRGC